MNSLVFKKILLAVVILAATVKARASDTEERVELWKVETHERILDAKDEAQKEVDQSKVEYEQTLKQSALQSSAVTFIGSDS